MKRYDDPKWTADQALTLDYNYAMADFVGEQGLTDADLAALAPRLGAVQADLEAGRQSGRLAFFDLPYQTARLADIKKVAKPILEWCHNVVILGIGGSALGARALRQALLHPRYNNLPLGRRHHRPCLYVADNIDPDFFFGLLDSLELRRTAFNVISKSGSTAETQAQFLFIYRLLKARFGEQRARELIILTTDPEQGCLRKLAAREGFPSLAIPPQVGGRFSVLTAVGLLPAALMGVDLEELLAGARFMDERLRGAAPEQNLALRLAALYYLFATKGRPILVIMPYASTLAGMADWFCQLWAESLGKKYDLQGNVVQTGSTPVRAVGVTDQHSQLQLYMEGPQDKVITFLEVDNFKHNLDIPGLYPDVDGLDYLGGHTLNELIKIEGTATAFNLMRAQRPNLTLKIPEINPFNIGQLIYLLEVATVAAGGLFGVNPLDQPGVEGGKKTTYALMGRSGYENFRQEFDAAPPKVSKYFIT